MSPNKPYMYLSFDGASDALVSASEAKNYPACHDELKHARIASLLADNGVDVPMDVRDGGVIISGAHADKAGIISRAISSHTSRSFGVSIMDAKSDFRQAFDVAMRGEMPAANERRAPSITGSSRPASYDYALAA